MDLNACAHDILKGEITSALTLGAGAVAVGAKGETTPGKGEK